MAKYHFVSINCIYDILDEKIKMGEDYIFNVSFGEHSFPIHAKKMGKESSFVNFSDRKMFFSYVEDMSFYMPFSLDKIISLRVPKTEQKFYFIKEDK